MRQGRFPRLRWVRWGLFVVLVVLIVGATGPRAWDQASGWFRDEYERLPWYATRITALLSSLAHIHLRNKKNYGRAESELKKALAISESVFGPEHLESTGVMISLGHLHLLKLHPFPSMVPVT